MSRFSTLVLLLFTMSMISCDKGTKNLSAGDFGDKWPFTVSSGEVECIGHDYQIVFESGGRTYALNDAAKASESFEDISVIVKPDPNYPGGLVKMDLSLIEFEALKLCQLDDR